MHVRSVWFPSPSLCLALALLSTGCAESIGFDDTSGSAADDETDEDPGSESGESIEQVEHDELGGGVVRTRVDASDEAAWIYLDLDDQHGYTEPEAGWDLGFRRFEILVNGGISGDEAVEVAILDGAEFEGLTAVPDDLAWITDAADGDDEDSDPDLALFDWYDYDVTTHVLTPKDRVYLIRTGDGDVFKLQIADYYSAAGSSGHFEFYWGAI